MAVDQERERRRDICIDPRDLCDTYRSPQTFSQHLSVKMTQKDQTRITGRQIAAARTLLSMGQTDLAAAASISVPTLKRMEASDGPAAGMANNVRAVIAVLEAAGLEFIPENGGGAGIRFRNRADGTREEH